jgi:hypothetical protein
MECEVDRATGIDRNPPGLTVGYLPGHITFLPFFQTFAAEPTAISPRMKDHPWC